MFISTSIGIVSAIGLAARVERVLARGELVVVALAARASRSSSTFQFNGRRPASVISAIMLDLVVGEAAQAAVGDVLERRALVVA